MDLIYSHISYYLDDQTVRKMNKLIIEFVNYACFSGSLLPLATGVHCLLNKPLNIFALVLESATNLLSKKRSGINGTLLSLQRPFNMDQ